MKEAGYKGISRRAFLKGLGAGVGAIGLPPMMSGLIGCSYPSTPLLLDGLEMVGKVTSDSSTIHLVGGESCLPSTKFQLFYDTVSHQSDPDAQNYAYQSSELTGISHRDPIAFDLDSLSPSSPYFYRLAYDEGDGWVFRDEHSFRTRRGAGESFRFCLAADTHVYPSLRTGDRGLVYKNVLADSPDFLITMGDECFVAYQGWAPYPWWSRETLWNTWQKTRSILDNACHSMFYLPVNGNHEGLFGWTTQDPIHQEILAGKMRYLPVPDSATFPEGGDEYGRYGAFRWGDVLVIWLDVVGFCTVDGVLPGNDNSDYILGGAQASFLQSTLENYSSVPWKFIFAHHLFGGLEECNLLVSEGYGRGNANGALLYDQGVVQDLMVQYDAQAFFYGHDHAFSVSQAGDVSYICAGHAASGCPWTEGLQQCYDPYILYSTDGQGAVPAGHVRVDVAPSGTTVSYIKASTGPDNGTVLASHVISL
jgi:hypothetical protein